MSLAYYIACTSVENCSSFTEGYHAISGILSEEKLLYLFQSAKSSSSFDEFRKMAG